jgi:hypothetical protein
MCDEAQILSRTEVLELLSRKARSRAIMALVEASDRAISQTAG